MIFSRQLKFLLFFLFLSVAKIYAQPLGNEWIDFSKTYHKIKVAQDGVYRIPFSTLNNISGLNLSTVRGSDFILYYMGEIVPIYVSTNNFFTQNDYIEFYGKRNDGTLDRLLYADPDNQQPNPYYSLYSDTSVYFLAWQTGNPRNIINITNDLTNLPAKETSCKQRSLIQQTAFFSPGKPYYSSDPLYRAIYEAGEGFQGAQNLIAKNTPYTATFNTDGALTTGTASLRFGLTGTSNNQHATNVRFNNSTIWDTTYFSYSFNIKQFQLPQNNFSASNILTFTASGSGATDNNTISYAELIYNRNFNFNTLTSNAFSINGSMGVKFIEIAGFNEQSSTPILYDLTNNARIVGSSSNPLQFKLPSAPAVADRNLYLFSEATIQTITELEAITFTNYSNTANQCAFCIISHPKLYNDGFGNDWVGEYRKYRQTIAGGNWVSNVINIEELYDQFAYGVKKHPLSIRNFSRFAMSNFSTKPEYFFLIGKGRVYEPMRNNQSNPNGAYAQCLVPTFGAKAGNSGGSDNLLAAPSTNTITPAIPVGRLSVVNGEQVRIYLQKVKDLEDHQNKSGDPYQTIANKLWTKNLLHMGGGTSANERVRFANYLAQFASAVECEHYGANVKTYLKTSIDPIQIGFAQDITNRLNEGVSLMTFFGHSSTNTFDISVDEPRNWTNFKKYPLVMSNGCFTGNVFSAGQGISEEFVLSENKGAIGFLSTTSLSSSTGLYYYANEFYNQFGKTLYNESVGDAMKATSLYLEQTFANDAFTQMIAEEMTLNGDPSVKINTHAKPDYVLEPQMISFNPAVVNVEDASFTRRVIVPNLGRAIIVPDSIVLSVDRVFPGGSTLRYEKKILAPCYIDTVDIEIPTGAASAFGLNNFIIKIEDEDKIDELSETNNTVGVSLNILSDDIFPIYPYEFAIVNRAEDSLTLAASTANSFASQKTYLIEIDTTELFNSSFKKSQTFTMTGGLLKWRLPFLLSSMPDSTVYYWRVGLDSISNSNFRGYNYSSFVYLPNDSAGWNQSHYYQWQKNEYNNVFLDNDRVFKYIDDTKQISVYTGTCGGASATVNDCQRIGYSLNGGTREKLVCGGRGYPSGLSVAVFDPTTGEPWISKLSDVGVDPCTGFLINQVHKNIHCNPGTARDFEAFNFPIGSTSASCGANLWPQRMLDFLNSIPNGHYVLIYSASVSGGIGYNNMGNPLATAIASLGSTQVFNLQGLHPNTPWSFFAQKGTPSFAPSESVGTINQPLKFDATFNVNWYQGGYKTPLIGPAFKWKDMFWESNSLEQPSTDNVFVNIIGVRPDKTETVVVSNINAPNYNLAAIDANAFPYLRLQFDTRDDTNRTASQLYYWKIIHDIVPEAALAPNIYFEFDSTIALGENLDLKVAIENVTPVHMDSMLVKYSIISAGNQTTVAYARYDSLRSRQSYNLDYKFNTNCNCLNDINTLIIEANPDDDQREQFHFNNIAILNFSVIGDNKNPLLDVTFDGTHIINGDIVSAEPEILITLKDENKYLALDDTALIKIFLKYPDGSIEPQYFTNGLMTFIPATPSQLGRKNEAQVEMRKRFEQDGKYELQVQARDRSRNISGTYGDPTVGIDYRIEFEVINKEMITNVINYPNPFSTATKFVFTLTGSEIPTYMKIQIMTISGKVVREIEMGELGPIRIGRNITEFAWDGTDQYGDRLANGLYFYRVVASKNGKQLEKLETSADKYFKSGLGKMYMVK
jgi:hypothetical protein